MVPCYCPQHLDLPVGEDGPLAARLGVADVIHGILGCVAAPGHKHRKHEPLTDGERAVLKAHNFPWFNGFWPSIYIGKNNEGEYTTSCATLQEAKDLQSATVKLGIGYFDVKKCKVVGRLRKTPC